MEGKKVVMEFLAAVKEVNLEGKVDLEKVKALWNAHPDEIAMGLSKRRALEVYNLFENYGMADERDRFYGIATKNEHPAAQDLIAAKHVRYVR